MRSVFSDMILRESTSGVYPCLRGPAHVRWAWRVYKRTSIHKQMYLQIQAYTYTRLCVYIRGNTRARTRGIAPPLTSLRSFLPTFYCQIWPLLNHMCASLYIVYVCNINTNKHTSVLFAKSSFFSAIYTRLHVWCREAFIAAIKEMCERDRDTMRGISSIILQ